jgi:PAT family beta-lactamase induction signal transducer AmpG
LYLPHFFALAIFLLFIVAFSGATHDIAADGVYMSVLSKSDQAKYIGWQGAFYNLAKIVATGGLVYLAGFLIGKWESVNAWACVMSLCALVLLLLGLYHIRAVPSGTETDKRASSFRELVDELWEVIRTFFAKKHIIWYICFILLYRFAEGFVVKIVPLFLKAPVTNNGLGLNEQQIGLYYGTFGALAFVLGSLLSGYYVSSLGLKKTLFTLCCAFNIPFSVYLLLAVFQPSEAWLIAGGIVFEYFGYGFGYVGLTLFMMQQIAPGKHQMAHYAFATGIMNLGVMLPGMFSGFVSDWLGYKHFFIFVMIATIPSFVITRLVPFVYPDEK